MIFQLQNFISASVAELVDALDLKKLYLVQLEPSSYYSLYAFTNENTTLIVAQRTFFCTFHILFYNYGENRTIYTKWVLDCFADVYLKG